MTDNAELREPLPKRESSEFRSALALLSQLMSEPTVASALGELENPQTRKVYTEAVTIWVLILQRLGKGLSLSETVSQLLKFDRNLLPDNKRVREGTLSQNTSAYHAARQRLSLDKVLTFSQQVCDYLGRTSEPVFSDRRVFTLDGTTITLPPTPQLRNAFPPAPNQHGESVWPVAMLMVAHELSSGCALLPQVDPMYGENRSSEAKQSRAIIERLPERSIVMADANFGIFSVAHACQQAGHDFVFRLTHQRFKALRKQAELHSEDAQCKTYQLTWRASDKDRQGTPELPKSAVIECFLHEIPLPEGKTLYLVTSLAVTAPCAGDLYSRRYDVEFDIRDVKVTLDTENIRAQSLPMAMKELMTSIVAFNLVAQFRRQAAKLAKVEPRKLSFTGVWLTFRYELLFCGATTEQQWLECYTAALIGASQRRLPNRKTPRNCPRQAHPRRQKSTKFQKSLRSKSDSEIPPLAPK
jgi:hypothetical protein